MYDLIIIGGGPAGCAAGVYAARKKLKSLLITEEFGGQSIVSEGIQNWIGAPVIPGAELAKSLENHVRTYAEGVVDIVDGVRIAKVEKTGDTFTVTDSTGKTYESKTVLVATGGQRRRLAVPGADEFEHKGLTYCASCDGPLFAGQDVAVVGGGNAGFETASQLLAYAKSVTLLHRSPEFKADPITVEKVLKHPNMTALKNAEPTTVMGDKFVTGLKYKDTTTGEEKGLSVSGIFIEIGMVPSTDFVKGLVDLDPIGRIVTNAKNQQTSTSGVWAAGDCTDELYHQNNIAAGDGVKALEDIYIHLNAR